VEVIAAKPDAPVERPLHRAPVINTTAEAAEGRKQRNDGKVAQPA
jgi:hypothetical protein